MAEYRRSGMSKQEAQHAYDARVQHEMAEDRERQWWGVCVIATVNGTEVGRASLWGIDETPSYDPARYMRDVAAELIDEAIDIARKDMAGTIHDTEEMVAAMRRAVAPTVSLAKGVAA
jgi:hypothetical protein